MNLQPLYDVKERLEQAAVAGTGLLGEDFRLQRAAGELKPLTAASPVFGKISAGLDKLLSAPAEERSGLLLDLLALLDAVAYTQGRTGAEGKLSPLPAGSGSCCNVSYGQLQPLIAALTTTGGGRVEVIKDTWENHPEFFSDFRILPALIAGLGDSYGEIGELSAKILKQTGAAVLPLLKEGFDPAGKKEMARRVEVISAIEGANATPWLLEILPRAKKDVRAAVLTALGEDQENTALLLELSKTERGKNRDVVLNALSRMNGDEVRDFWQNEIAKKPESISFLQESSTDWAAELVVLGMRERLETAMYQRRIVTRELKAELQKWCAALRGGKASSAMLDFWRWADEHFADIQRLESVGNQDFRLTSHMTTRLMENLCAAGPGPLCDLCLELWEAHRDQPRYLPHAVTAALMTRPAAEVYDTFASYVPTSMPLAGKEEKKVLSIALLRGLRRVSWSDEAGTWLVDNIYPLAQPLDPRWMERLTHAVWKTTGVASSTTPYTYWESVDEFDVIVTALADPEDGETRKLLVPYLRNRMTVHGQAYTYCRWLFRLGGSPKGVLGKALAKNPDANRLYTVWNLMWEISKALPAEETIELLEEVRASGAFHKAAKAQLERALSAAVALLKAGQPFPSNIDWSKL